MNQEYNFVPFPNSENDSSEDTEFQIKFFEKLLKDNPQFLPALIPLGDLYTQKGFYKKGLLIDKKLASLRPQDPIVFYNLACDYSLLNRIEEAIKALKKSINLGYRDFSYMMNDPDLKNLRASIQFKEFLEKYIQPKQKKRSRL